MSLWLSLLLIVFVVFAALGVLQWKARASTARRNESFQQERNLATERLEKILLESTTKQKALTETESPTEGESVLKTS